LPPRGCAAQPPDAGHKASRLTRFFRTTEGELRDEATRRTWLALQPIRRVTFIANVNPGQDPSDGPNYFNFDHEVQYTINIDNDRDGKADDIVYEFRFKTERNRRLRAGSAADSRRWRQLLDYGEETFDR